MPLSFVGNCTEMFSALVTICLRCSGSLICSWVKCDPVDILRDVDVSYFSHVEDRRFQKYGDELQKRLADLTSQRTLSTA